MGRLLEEPVEVRAGAREPMHTGQMRVPLLGLDGRFAMEIGESAGAPAALAA